MGATIEREGRTVRLVIGGDVDLGTSDEIRATAMDALAEPGCRHLELDLSGVTFIDSTGIGVLVDLRNAAVHAEKDFTLRRPSDRVTELLKLVALDTFFAIAEPRTS